MSSVEVVREVMLDDNVRTLEFCWVDRFENLKGDWEWVKSREFEKDRLC